MASRRKTRPLKGSGRDGRDYGEFIDGLVDGSIRATLLVDTTVPDGTQQIVIKRRDEDGGVSLDEAHGTPLPDETVTVPKRRLTKLEYDDPQG